MPEGAQHIEHTGKEQAAAGVCVLVCMHECVQCVTVYRGNAWRIQGS